jgi:uncharacterized 2Fe-2S/4Fe-4S cluster protein (DUF4445 family)
VNDLSIELLPQEKLLAVRPGAPLREVLFAQGVEFPCGGRGRCKGCRIKVLSGSLPATPEESAAFSPLEISSGWRLACRAHVVTDLKIEIAQWETVMLADNTEFEFSPQPGVGVAIDLGTTTVVAQALDLRTGAVLAIRSALNDQAQYGADIMSRVEFALEPDRRAALTGMIREQIGRIGAELLAAANRPGDLKRIVLVGNTVMHHLFCGFKIEPLAHHPFETETGGLQIFSPHDLGWDLQGGAGATVSFLPCVGGFIGSDILAGIIATRIHQQEGVSVLIDLGTNGEMVVGNRHRMLCASTAAGPAFEGGRIFWGMRAATGAISEARIENGQWICRVLGGTAARGLCGSGLVDAVASALEANAILPNGRLAVPGSLPLAPPVWLSQTDIRELQLAKGAIAAGLRILLETWGSPEISRVFLAGAFGNYLNVAGAQRIGLFPFPEIAPAGNTALLGAKMALFDSEESDFDWAGILPKIQRVSLSDHPRFEEIYCAELAFPQVQTFSL